MNEKTFKERICQAYGLEEGQYLPFMLRHTLFLRMRIFGPLFRIFNPDFFLAEHRLLESVARAVSLKEVSEEVDFYQHKFVVNYLLKDSLRFRVSGLRLLRLASRLFAEDRIPSA